MAKYQILTDEMFRDMMQSDKGIREARYAIGYGRWLNGESVTDGHYVDWPDYRSKWEISEEQMSKAKERFEQRKAEVMERVSKPGVLCFHAMGMDYEPTVEDGIGNYRIRANFKDKTGHEWFIELHPHRDWNINADESKGAWGEVYDTARNAAEKKAYEDERERVLEKYGTWWKIPTNERPHCPMTHYENIEAAGPFTYGNILSWINHRFGTDYKELYLERYFLECDDTISEC